MATYKTLADATKASKLTAGKGKAAPLSFKTKTGKTKKYRVGHNSGAG